MKSLEHTRGLRKLTLTLTFRERLMQELEARRAVNRRYSLRAFAAMLGVDHATLSQILRSKRSVPLERIVPWARQLKVPPEEAAVYAAVGRVMEEQAWAREEQLRHWAAETLALLTQPVHRDILLLVRSPAFRADSRWLAEKIGVGVDDVNIALSRLLRLGLLEVKSANEWVERTGLREITARSFRRYVTERIPSTLEETR